MNDGSQLIVDCVVCLAAVAWAYVYLRESFSGEQAPLETQSLNIALAIKGVGGR